MSGHIIFYFSSYNAEVDLML